MWGCVQVKEEAWDWEGASEAAREGLYAGHEVKRGQGGLPVGPAALQPQDAAFRLEPKIEVTVVKEELSDVESDGAGNCASSKQGNCSDEKCHTNNGRQQLLRPCTVQIERIPVEKEQQSVHNAIQHKILCPELKDDRHIDILSRYTKAGTFTCDSCGLPFMLRTKIIRHLRTCSIKASKVTREITAPLSCKICNKHFKARFSLKKHEQIHTGLKPYNCEICGKQYSQISHLNRHKRRTHASQPRNIETHSCEMCGKKYRTKYDLVTHMRIHNGQMPYICQCCGKQFNKLSTVIKHENTHAVKTEKTCYSCEVCSKQLATKWNLTKHKRSHTNETPYSCDVCDKKYMHSYSLTKHKRSWKHAVKSNLLIQTGNRSSKKDCGDL